VRGITVAAVPPSERAGLTSDPLVIRTRIGKIVFQPFDILALVVATIRSS